MDFEKRLNELSEYDVSFEIKQGYYHVSLVYKDGWDVVSCDNEYIYIEQRNGVCHYLASADSVNIDDIFNAIESTINYNIDLQKKLELFRKKTEELQELFAKESLDVLETIEFKYGKKEEPVKKKRGRKPKKKDVEEEQVKQEETPVKEEPQPEENTPPTPVQEEEEHIDYCQEEEVIPMEEGFMEEVER